MPAVSDMQLVQGCRAEDRRAQRQLFETFSDEMMIVCRRYISCPQRAEAAMIAGFFKFFTSIQRFIFSGEGSIAPWLRKIVINECLMDIRGRINLPEGDERIAETIASRLPTAIDHLSTAELHTLIEALPDGYRTVFNLFVVDGYSHKEIALFLGVTEGTSKSQLSKARALLQTRIHKQTHCHETR